MVVEFFIQLVDVFEDREVGEVGAVGDNFGEGINGDDNNRATYYGNEYNSSNYNKNNNYNTNNITNSNQNRLSLTRKTNNTLFIDSSITRKT